MVRAVAMGVVVALVSSAGVASAQVFNGGLPAGFSCVGSCGTTAANGDVGTAPGGGTQFGYVTTYNSEATPNPFSIAGTTNGSTLTSYTFSASAGQTLSFAFNYITSDGTPTFPDYAYVQLLGGESPITLFTARTRPAGEPTVPGFGLPGISPGVTLNPAGVTVTPDEPDFAPLGGSSGTCFGGVGNGCGYTGWVIAQYTVGATGNFQLLFGISNFSDELYDSALAFDFGSGIGNVPTVPGTPPSTVPEPSTLALLASGLLAVGAGARRRLRG